MDITESYARKASAQILEGDRNDKLPNENVKKISKLPKQYIKSTPTHWIKKYDTYQVQRSQLNEYDQIMILKKMLLRPPIIDSDINEFSSRDKQNIDSLQWSKTEQINSYKTMLVYGNKGFPFVDVCSELFKFKEASTEIPEEIENHFIGFEINDNLLNEIAKKISMLSEIENKKTTALKASTEIPEEIENHFIGFEINDNLLNKIAKKISMLSEIENKKTTALKASTEIIEEIENPFIGFTINDNLTKTISVKISTISTKSPVLKLLPVSQRNTEI